MPKVTTGRPPTLAMAVISLAPSLTVATSLNLIDRPAPKRYLALAELVSVTGIAKHAHRLPRTGNFGLTAACVGVALAQRRVDLRSGHT